MLGGRVLIVGGGIAGLSASIALAEAGFDVSVVEVQPDLRSSVQGVGILQPINALRALDAIGCADACMEQGFPARVWMRIHDVDGNLIREVPGGRIPGTSLPPLNGITRPRLHAILTARALGCGVAIDYGRTIATLDDRGDRVEVVFDDLTTTTVEVVVGADGIRSAVRPYVQPDVTPIYNGQATIRVNIPREPEVDCMYQHVYPTLSAGIVPLSDELAYLFVSTTWERDHRPPQHEWHVILRELLGPFGGLMGRVRDMYINERASIDFRRTDWLIAPPPWHRGRIVLIGDAVHSVTPHLGQGAAQAIEDGIVLAEELASHDSVQAAFEAYLRRRYDRCKSVADASAQLGEWQQRPDPDADDVGLRQHMNEVLLAPI